jgi:phosphoribosylanthranilate isomerase
MYIKICGITQPEQAEAIADLGIDALGFICVPASKRYVTTERLAEITTPLASTVERIGVFMNAPCQVIGTIVKNCQLSGVQLHGQESTGYCAELREILPNIKLIKAIPVKSPADLDWAISYQEVVDTLLLDAYDPHMAGGTGKQINWTSLKGFQPTIPWWLAGGLNHTNVLSALSLAKPDGIDLSSGVESSAGIKDLDKVRQLLASLRNHPPKSKNP